MADKRKSRPHLEFASLLQQWRAKTYPTALDFFQDSSLSFSYGTYSAFERGEGIPTINQLFEITDALKENRKTSVIWWLNAQVTDSEIKRFLNQVLNTATEAIEQKKSISL